MSSKFLSTLNGEPKSFYQSATDEHEKYLLERVKNQKMFKFARRITYWCDDLHSINVNLINKMKMEIPASQIIVHYDITLSELMLKRYDKEWIKKEVAYSSKQTVNVGVILDESRVVHSSIIRHKDIKKIMIVDDLRTSRNTWGCARLIYYVLTGKIYG